MDGDQGEDLVGAWVGSEENRWRGNSDNMFGKAILDVALTQIETIVKPDSVGDDIWREAVVCKYSSADSINIEPLTCQYHIND